MFKETPINISNNTIGDGFVNLEQEKNEKTYEYPTIKDIYYMWLQAVTGKSAMLMRPISCPVEFDGETINIYLGFYVWLSDENIQYSLSSTFGEISVGQKIKKNRELSKFINNSNTVKFDYIMKDVSIEWEMPCYNSIGQEIPRPGYKILQTGIRFDYPVFSCIRIKGKAIGYYHLCKISLNKKIEEEELSQEEIVDQEHYERGGEDYFIITPSNKTRLNSFKIENLESTINCLWGKDKTEQMRLILPKCVEEVLSFCPDMFKVVVLWCSKISTRQVYYSTCNGSLVAIYDGKDTKNYCNKIESGLPGGTVWDMLRGIANG